MPLVTRKMPLVTNQKSQPGPAGRGDRIVAVTRARPLTSRLSAAAAAGSFESTNGTYPRIAIRGYVKQNVPSDGHPSPSESEPAPMSLSAFPSGHWHGPGAGQVTRTRSEVVRPSFK
jgi:hypothetical protein